jgi:alkyldihydroxyacetonephosphate synthase
MVECLRVVTPTATIQNRRLPASGAGPKPDRAFIGSEGTLGIITEAWMRLQGRIKFRANASVSFKSFYEGAKAVRQITQAGLYPANCRYLDEKDASFYGAGNGSESMLLIGYESADHPVDAWLERSLEICRDFGGTLKQRAGTGDNALETSRSGQQGSWRNQFRYLPYLMHVRAAMGIISFTFETAYTWDKFESIDTEIMRRVSEAQKTICGGGIVCRRFSFLYPDGPAPYYSIMAPSSHDKNIEHTTALHKVASDALSELGATITHHHAVGRGFRPWYDKEMDPGFIRMMKASKREIDPHWILNPGILFDRPNA